MLNYETLLIFIYFLILYRGLSAREKILSQDSRVVARGFNFGKIIWSKAASNAGQKMSYLFFFFLREFQPMASAPDDSSFITKPGHQSVFGVGRDWTLDLLYNHKRFYQLSWLAPTTKKKWKWWKNELS